MSEAAARGDGGEMEEELGDAVSQFGTFMHNIESKLHTMMEKSYRAPADAREHFQAFAAAINWNQTWIRCLLGFHVLNFIFFIVTRNNADVQAAQFVFICLVVMFSERINTYCSLNYKDFSDQNYFDSRGAFIGLMFSGPMLLVCMFQLFNFLRLAGSALIKAKRMELASKRKPKTKSANKTD